MNLIHTLSNKQIIQLINSIICHWHQKTELKIIQLSNCNYRIQNKIMKFFNQTNHQPELIPGLQIVTDFISIPQEKYLISKVNSSPWSNALKRRTQHYGFEYDYKSRNKLNPAEPFEPYMNRLVAKINRETELNFHPDQMIINEYKPGQGISAHIDNPRIFSDTICGISLGSGAEMVFKCGSDVRSYYLKPRSLIVMQGDARYKYTHEIPGKKIDTIGSIRKPRSTRISLTFRKTK